MVGTIGLAGSQARQRNVFERWLIPVGATHAVGGLLGGLVLGGLVAFLGRLWQELVGAVPAGAVVAVLALLAVVDAFGVSAKYLSRAKQVPMSWKHVFPAPMSSALYGFLLGIGIGTTVYFWSFHALLVAIFARADLSIGAIAGIAYGLARAMPPLLTAFIGDEEGVDRVSDYLGRRRYLIRFPEIAVITTTAWGFSTLL